MSNDTYEEVWWPEVFKTGLFPTTGYNLAHDRKQACAYGLAGWGNCMAGFGPIPTKFGEGMVTLGRFLGIDPLPEEFMKYADTLESSGIEIA